MGNPLRYIKDLEAVGVPRAQAEAQIQVLMDAIQGDLVTKSDFQNFRDQVDHRFTQNQQAMQDQFKDVRADFRNEFQDIRNEIKTSGLNLFVRLGFLMVSVASVGVAVLTWLIKLH